MKTENMEPVAGIKPAGSLVAAATLASLSGDRRLRKPQPAFAILALLVLTGCASAGGPLTLTEDAIHDSLAKVDDGVRIKCAENPELLKVVCADARAALIPALEAGSAFNRAVAQQKIGSAVDLISAIGRLVDVLKKFPQSDTAAWVQELARTLAAAYQILGGK